MEKITMSKKELRQIGVFEKLAEGIITQSEASEFLRMSLRQIQRKWKRFNVVTGVFYNHATFKHNSAANRADKFIQRT